MVTTDGAGQILFELLARIIILVLTAKATFPVSESEQITRVDVGRIMNSHAIAADSGIHIRIFPAITLGLPLLIGIRF